VADWLTDWLTAAPCWWHWQAGRQAPVLRLV
jgi:hypothetical protein